MGAPCARGCAPCQEINSRVENNIKNNDEAREGFEGKVRDGFSGLGVLYASNAISGRRDTECRLQVLWSRIYSEADFAGLRRTGRFKNAGTLSAKPWACAVTGPSLLVEGRRADGLVVGDTGLEFSASRLFAFEVFRSWRGAREDD